MKNTILISCPIDSKSGYGYHSRDIVKSIFNLYRDTYNIKIFPVTWGGTPNGVLDKNIPIEKEIIDNILAEQLPKRPEIFINISVPNEFQNVGTYLNIGITAGIETSMCSQPWIEGCNRMDMIIVPSLHAKNVFLNTVIEKRDTTNNTLIETIKVNKPIEVLFEGVDLNIFNPDKAHSDFNLGNDINNIKEDFLLLTVGMWLPGELGEDRKNISGLIKTFFDTFKNTENAPGLLLKVSGGNYSELDKFNIFKKIDKIAKLFNGYTLPNVYLLHGDLSDSDLNELYNHEKIKALVSFTKGEGYGRPLAEFSTTGKPIIATQWSGHLDFLSSKNSVLLPGQLTRVHPSVVWENVIIPESSWFTVNYEVASKQLLDVWKNYNIYVKSSSHTKVLIQNFTLEKMQELLGTMLTTKLDLVPKLLNLKLPTLKKL